MQEVTETKSKALKVVNDNEIVIDQAIIENAIIDACERLNIPDLKKAKQREFKAVLTHIGLTVFPNRKALKDNKLYFKCTGNNNNNLMSNNDRYNYLLLYKLCEVYINICNIYNKVIDINGFCMFCNIDDEIVYQWGYKGEESNPPAYQIYKRLYKHGETSLQDSLIDTGQAVGMIAVGNNRFKWSEQEQAGITRAKIQSLDSLPTLEVVKTVDII